MPVWSVPDVGSGVQLDVLLDANLQLINPINIPSCHPLPDVIITGSSGNLYCWCPESEEEAAAAAAEEEGAGGGAEDWGGSRASGCRLAGSRLFSVYELQADQKKKRQKQKPAKKKQKS